MKRYVETDRWKDKFFIELSPYAKLMLSYLYDNANEAGIFDVHFPFMEVQLKMKKIDIKEAMLELKPLLLSDGKNKLFIKDFLKHQMKLPLIKGNTENDWIISKLESNLEKFRNAPEIKSILDNIETEKEKENDNVVESQKRTNTKKRQTREIKEFIKPTLDEFIVYFIENGKTEDLATAAWKGYEEAEWHDSQDTKIKNWKQKCQHTWFTKSNGSGKSSNHNHSEEKKSKTNVSFSVVDELKRERSNTENTDGK